MLDELLWYFVHYRKGKVTDMAVDAAGVLLAWMSLWLGGRRQSLAPQKVYVRIQDGREYWEKSSRYRW
jgi:hypothetical protein